MDKTSKIYIAGHNGMVGSAIWRNLTNKGFTNLLGRNSSELNLINQKAVEEFFSKEKPEYVILAAAKVGGIVANNIYRADFIYENIQIQNNVIHNSYKYKVKKLLFLGSSCIYPKNALQPLKEEYLLTSELEYTNEPYAIAKIAGIKMCESYNIQYDTNFISVMPTNLYGPNDNYDLEKSHVLPALIRKMHLGKCLENNDWKSIKTDFNKLPIEGVNGNENKTVILNVLEKYGIKFDGKSKKVSIELWGSGEPLREFLHADDMAEACCFIIEQINFSELKANYKEIKNTHINIGSGVDISIKDLAIKVKDTIGFSGKIEWNTEMPDGTYRKLLDVSKINNLGWKYNILLDNGIKLVYNNYLN
ncbi:GDP-L-fucose synthase [Aureibaculum sp. A20]|uniref:GDP-L-fucose synthase n=1 Tax=Aureibaculum flavum TaxID=2795986 RepID=A0ABS0WKZ7_9FLAO|nr:GDP-L-fucose synthase [Aureibaculum flavum]MBJ2172614.1 GDP-L-fucose synthase [Aureibaculum flavum]